jgi:hypothetical protein
MTTGRVVSAEAEEVAKLAALRDAAKVGLASIEAGNARKFSDADRLKHYLKIVAAEAIQHAEKKL